jgi:DNA processing protein
MTRPPAQPPHGAAPGTPEETERRDRLRLIRTEHVGPITFSRLLQCYGSASRALEALPELAARGGRSRPRICTVDEAEWELAAIQRLGARLIAWDDPIYPALLREIEDAPPLVFVLGAVELLGRPAVAVVGSRDASLNGRRLAEMLARDLGGAGYVVVSGLARGIDAAAHRGALETGTVAVMAGGVDVIYPQENAELYRSIVAGGAVIAEMAVGTQPQARHFPRRNRLISGLASGVLVVEANPRSGSLITARLALEQNREVFAVPGSPLDGRARGCNDLIRQGATLTETAQDVVRVLGSGRTAPVLPAPRVLPSFADAVDPAAPLDGARDAVARLLTSSPVDLDDLIRNCHLSAGMVHTILLEWELAGRLERHPGNKVALIGSLEGA